MKAVAFAWVNDVMVMVESGRPIGDDDWDGYTAEFLRRATSHADNKCLVLASAAAPSAAQRAKFKVALGSKKVRAAIMSDSVITRAAIAAFSLFIGGVRGFSMQGIDAALDYLEVTRGARYEIEREIARLRQSLVPTAATG